jgi:hypothetical protein
MYIRQRDVVVGAVLVLYIVLFALSPPAAVSTILSHPVGVAASFGVAVYTTLYYSKPIGALLIVALLASMTSATEHLTVGGVTIADGKSYGCVGSSEFGMVEGGRLRGYANATVAASYDSAWSSAPKINCTGVPRGSMITTPKTSATTARTYQTLATTDYFGQGDIRVVTGDVATCRTQCDSTANCKGFVRIGTNCFLKNDSVRTPTYRADATYHYTGAAPSAAATAPAAPATAPAAPARPPTTTPPITTPTAPAVTSPPAARPPAVTPTPPPAAPKPVMACNIENFAPF